MIQLDIPGYGELRLQHLVLDVNGTIAAGGELVEGVAEGIGPGGDAADGCSDCRYARNRSRSG